MALWFKGSSNPVIFQRQVLKYLQVKYYGFLFTLKYLNNKKYKTKLKQSKQSRIEQRGKDGKKNYSKQILGTRGLILVLPSFGQLLNFYKKLGKKSSSGLGTTTPVIFKYSVCKTDLKQLFRSLSLAENQEFHIFIITISKTSVS